MEIRKIQGLTKAEFLERCIIAANDINPNWEMDIFNTANFVPNIIWASSANCAGFALSAHGAKFFERALELQPYYIEARFMYSRDILNLNKLMPWPFTVSRYDGMLVSRIGIYSSEVAVWAALYDNDLDKLLDAYARK